MRTFERTITTTEPLLKISREDGGDIDSPREWTNLGYWIQIDREYHSPDRIDWIEDLVKSTGEEATSQEDHIARIKKGIEEDERGEKVLEIYPVVKYEHSGVSYSMGTTHGFDYNNNGFYIITEKSQKETGTEPKDFVKVIKQEIEAYNKWANGEVYRFKLYNENWKTVAEVFTSWKIYGNSYPKTGRTRTLQIT
jgi:hypothetical protein